MNLQEKVEIYNKILAGLSKGVKLAAELDEQGEEELLRQVERKNNTLARQAADLRRNISATWRGRAQDILTSIRQTNDKLQRQIRRIEEQVDVAERVVKALGHIDVLIRIAAKIFA